MSELAVFDGLVAVREMPGQGMITLRGDLEAEGFGAALKQVTGVACPGQRQVQSMGDTAVLWMSPDELMIVLPRARAGEVTAKLADALAGEHALALDVSDARVNFELEGRYLREVLAKLAPVDMHPESFPVGEIRRTRLGQVAAGFWLRDERTAQVFCFRSVRDYMFGLLSAGADPDAPVGLFVK